MFNSHFTVVLWWTLLRSLAKLNDLCESVTRDSSSTLRGPLVPICNPLNNNDTTNTCLITPHVCCRPPWANASPHCTGRFRVASVENLSDWVFTHTHTHTQHLFTDVSVPDLSQFPSMTTMIEIDGCIRRIQHNQDTKVLKTSVWTNTVCNYIRKKEGEIESFTTLEIVTLKWCKEHIPRDGMYRENGNAPRRTAHFCYILKESLRQPSQETGSWQRGKAETSLEND